LPTLPQLAFTPLFLSTVNSSVYVGNPIEWSVWIIIGKESFSLGKRNCFQRFEV
jgi:hypothetical protein